MKVDRQRPEGETMITFGGSVKALGNGRIGGHLVLFGGPDNLDLTGEYFTPETDYDIEEGAKSTVYYDHGLDPQLKHRKLGRGLLRQDEVGVWIEAQLALRDEYERAVYGMVEAGKLGWSSGTASHLVEREPIGADAGYPKAYRITRWPLGLDASLTPVPAEPRTQVIPLKSYVDQHWCPTLEVSRTRTTSDSVRGPKGVQEGAPAGTAMEAGDGAETKRKKSQTKTDEGDETVDINYEELAGAVMKAMAAQGQAEQQTDGDESTDPAIKAIQAQMEAVSALLERLEAADGGREGGYATGEGREGTKSFTDFLLSVRRDDGRRLAEVYGSTKAAMAEESGATGGYLVPAEFIPQLMQVAAETAVVRPRATTIPMRSRSLTIPMLDQTTAPSAGDTAFFGGLKAYWTEEAGTMTETEPEFKQVELVAHKLSGYTLASDELMADNAVALEALLLRLFGQAIAWYEDYAFLRGDGVGKPLGVLNSPAALSETRANASQFGLDDAAQMLAKLFPGSMGNAVWVMSQGVIPQLVQMADAGSNVIWIPNAREALPMTLFNRPIVFTEKLPALGTAGDVMLCDFTYYLLGDRQAVQIAASEHYRFVNDQTTWRFVHRVDGQPWLDGAITLADASTQVSPFVYLN